MANLFQSKPIAAIDIGTTKICVIVARIHEDDSIEVLGIAKAPSQGLKKGVVVDIAQTTRSLRIALTQAQLMSGITIDSVIIGVSGGHIKSQNSTGIIPIKRGVVSDADLTHALEAAKAIPIPDGMQLLHAIPQYYLIDAQDSVQDPRGMHGVRLEVQAHLVLGALNSVQNLIDCCHNAGVQVEDIVLEQLASANAVLTNDERDLGVGILDIGGGTSDLAIFYQGSIRHTKVFPVAGNQMTNDIAVGLRLSVNDAERIKREIACVHESVLRSEFVNAHQAYHQSMIEVSMHDVFCIIKPRVEELFELVAHEIHENRLYVGLTSGIVLTGGGALLHGITDFATEVFKMPVRIGSPLESRWSVSSVQTPIFSTCCGLIEFAHKRAIDRSNREPIYKRVMERMKSWVYEVF